MMKYEVQMKFWQRGRRYDAGGLIELTEQEAAHLLRGGKIAPVGEEDRGRKTEGRKRKSPPQPPIPEAGTVNDEKPEVEVKEKGEEQ
jgi:hypothetical protein